MRFSKLALVVLAVAAVLLIGAYGQERGAVVRSAPVMSLRHIFVGTTPVTVSLPASVEVIGCVDVSSSGVGVSPGCNLLVSVDESAPLVSVTFRKQATQPHPNNTVVYDAAIEHPVAGWFQRAGFVAIPYVILQSN